MDHRGALRLLDRSRRGLTKLLLMSVIDLILGAELIGVLVGTFLWGVAIVQTFNFFFSPAQNALRLKVLVSIVWCVDPSLLGCTLSLNGTVVHWSHCT
jgi:hypothetical protein